MSDSFTRVLEAIHQQHRRDLGKMSFQIAVYRQQLQKAGIEPDDLLDEELERLWRSSARVISSASEFFAELGTSKELLADWRKDEAA